MRAPWANSIFKHFMCLATVFALQSCVIDEDIDPEQGGTPVEETLCGPLESLNVDREVGLEYGFDRPFMPSPFLGTEEDRLDLPMEYGLQGGHHVDLSLRFTGTFNPDLVDIIIELSVKGPLADQYYGYHETSAWYLLYPQESEASGCYFHRARIFLFDLEGQAVEPLGVEILDGSYATIDIKLSTADADYEWRTYGILHSAIMEP